MLPRCQESVCGVMGSRRCLAACRRCWNYFTDELSSGAEPPMEAHDHAWREHIEDNPVILSGKCLSF